jgi:thiamine pyrophosphate-dependent acetolactate synthase large subunit-like protein
VAGVRVDTPEQVEDAVKTMLASDGPFLIDLVIDNPAHPEGEVAQS